MLVTDVDVFASCMREWMFEACSFRAVGGAGSLVPVGHLLLSSRLQYLSWCVDVKI